MNLCKIIQLFLRMVKQLRTKLLIAIGKFEFDIIETLKLDKTIDSVKLTMGGDQGIIENTIRKGLLLMTKMVSDWDINSLEWLKILQIIMDSLPSKDFRGKPVLAFEVSVQNNFS